MSSHDGTPNHVVILGGGITGLAAAFYLARKHPTVQITVVEKSDRFGGWVRSERVEVSDSDGKRGKVLLEAGPRTVRPNAKFILELVQLLDLRSEVICTPRGSPAARNRFLHVPPAQGLQPLPSGLLSLFTLPLGRLVLRSVLTEPFVPANRPKKSLSQPPRAAEAASHTETPTSAVEAESGGDEDDDDQDDDESVNSFLSRRFGDAFARTLGSALVHGIYAADSRVLSVRAAFPVLGESEARGKGSVVWGELGPPAWFAGWGGGQGKKAPPPRGGEEMVVEGVDPEWEKRLRASAALFSFKEGMETLVRVLVRALRGFPNVTLRSGAAVRGIIGIDEAADADDEDRDRGNDDDRRFSFQINLDAKDDTRGGNADSDTTFLEATHVISALPLPVLDAILQSPAGVASTHTTMTTNTNTNTNTTLPHLHANPHASVTVLNLVFRNPSGAEKMPPLHPPGFGYLIPRPEHGYHPSSAPGPGPGSEAKETESEVAEAEPPRPNQEPPGLLGVVFDTASLPDQDDDATAAAFTKLTAMLGGPYQTARSRSCSSSSDAELVAAVLPRIAEHLGRALPPPVHYAVHRNGECIPTYLVGHTARMRELRRVVRDRWGGRMKVVGAGVGGVSLADCVKAGRQVAYEVGAQIGN